MMADFVHLCLLNLPLREPALVERQSDIDTERVFRDITCGGATHPLATDIEDGTVVPTVHDWDAKSEARSSPLGRPNRLYNNKVWHKTLPDGNEPC